MNEQYVAQAMDELFLDEDEDAQAMHKQYVAQAKNVVNIRDILNLQKCFEDADVDHSGDLDVDEFVAAFRNVTSTSMFRYPLSLSSSSSSYYYLSALSFLPPPPPFPPLCLPYSTNTSTFRGKSDTQLQQLFMRIDVDANGTMSWKEFLEYMILGQKNSQNADTHGGDDKKGSSASGGGGGGGNGLVEDNPYQVPTHSHSLSPLDFPAPPLLPSSVLCVRPETNTTRQSPPTDPFLTPYPPPDQPRGHRGVCAAPLKVNPPHLRAAAAKGLRCEGVRQRGRGRCREQLGRQR